MRNKFQISVKANFTRSSLTFLNKVLPKKKQVLVAGFPNVESSAIEVANYIFKNYNLPVLFLVDKKSSDDPTGILDPGIKIVYAAGSLSLKINYLLTGLTSKYLFLTHGLFVNKFSKRQVVVNIWHGILYKKIGVLLGRKPIPADITVGTSPLTKKMFSEAFGVTEKSVFVCGYPRNDVMIRANQNKKVTREKFGNELSSYAKILIWLPTFRQNGFREISQDGVETGNPFYIDNFDVERFNKLLSDNNVLCLIKPHPLAVQYKDSSSFSNLLFINDKWISDKKLSLYDLVGCTDILISDVSSIITDYLLLDQPIICMSADFEEYKDNRGFYFDNIEDWLPSKVLKNQSEFFNYLQFTLEDNDSEKSMKLDIKRKELKEKFFTFYDDKSTERLVSHVLPAKDKK